MVDKKKTIAIIAVLCILIIGAIVFAINTINKKLRDYDVEEITKKNYYPLYQNGKIGVINTKGEAVIEPIYENIQIPNPLKPVFICLSKYNKDKNSYDEITIRNDRNEEIFTQYDEVTSIAVSGISGEIPYEKSVLRYKKDNSYGIVDFEVNEITKPIYEEIKSLPYKEGEILVKKDGKYGVINRKGIQMVDIKYDEIIGDGYFDSNYKNAGYIVGTKEDNGYKYGYIRNDGKTLLKQEFNDIIRINEIKENDEIYLIASKNGKTGLYKNNKQVIPCEYQSLEYYEDANLLVAKKNDRYGIINMNGDTLIAVENKDISVKGIHIIATNDSGSNEYDFNGSIIKDTKYKSVTPVKNTEFFITVDKSNRYGLINQKGTEVIENKYAYLEYLTGKYFAVYNDSNKIGVIDNNGKIILDIKYDVMQKIKGSNVIQAINLTDRNIELYSSEMKQIASKTNADIYVYNNYIKLSNQESISYFDLNGNSVTNKELFTENILFATGRNGFWGFEDKEGNIKVDRKYESVTEFNEYGFAGIKSAGKWGIIDESGKIIVNPIYTIDQKNTEPEFLGKYYKINYNGAVYYTNAINE